MQVRVERKANPKDDDAAPEAVHTGKVVSLKHYKKEVPPPRQHLGMEVLNWLKKSTAAVASRLGLGLPWCCLDLT